MIGTSSLDSIIYKAITLPNSPLEKSFLEYVIYFNFNSAVHRDAQGSF